MTSPEECVDPGSFGVDADGGIYPLPHLTWRKVATSGMATIRRTFALTGNQAQDLATLRCSWTNTAPIPQRVYALLTRGSTTVTTCPRNHVYIETFYGSASGAAPADPSAETWVGRTGNGAYRGVYNGVTLQANWQTRLGQRTFGLGASSVIAPGATIKYAVRLRYDGWQWETTAVFGGSAEMEMSIDTGATQIDIFALPEWA